MCVSCGCALVCKLSLSKACSHLFSHVSSQVSVRVLSGSRALKRVLADMCPHRRALMGLICVCVCGHMIK